DQICPPHVSLPTTRRRPPAPPLFPYTTLFRSAAPIVVSSSPNAGSIGSGPTFPAYRNSPACSHGSPISCSVTPSKRVPPSRNRRSEEHTSELQSRENLVCRLLLEKKNELQTVP